MPERPHQARCCGASCENIHPVKIHLAVWCDLDYINARWGIILFRLLAMSAYGPGTCIEETYGFVLISREVSQRLCRFAELCTYRVVGLSQQGVGHKLIASFNSDIKNSEFGMSKFYLGRAASSRCLPRSFQNLNTTGSKLLTGAIQHVCISLSVIFLRIPHEWYTSNDVKRNSAIIIYCSDSTCR